MHLAEQQLRERCTRAKEDRRAQGARNPRVEEVADSGRYHCSMYPRLKA